MLAAVEAVDMGCKRRRSLAMAKENPGGDAAEESRGGAAREEGCTVREEAGLLVLQNLKMYVAVVPLKKGGWEAVRKLKQRDWYKDGFSRDKRVLTGTGTLLEPNWSARPLDPSAVRRNLIRTIRALGESEAVGDQYANKRVSPGGPDAKHH
ncbi:hypothetical protein NC652_010612 [Populus alba x Populus x berolinensis]|nr:hypothetical protein NC652_010612 [Populus alba x Populus x berolinensis]